MVHQESLTINTQGRGIYAIDSQVSKVILQSQIQLGTCQVFLHHTSASLIFCENADPSVKQDLENYLARLVPDGDPMFNHTQEGPDDMSAHIRNILTDTCLNMPISQGQLNLGTWQGLYLYEHRYNPHRRRMTITLVGE